ncbi:MAG: hypothetical protein ACRCZF_26215 [Gemmataceae bacterium]
MFAFADAEIIQLAQKAFIPCCADDWYQRRRKDAEGDFFRQVANQGPRKGAGGSTRQGIYTLTADGELLNFKNAGQDVAATRAQLAEALKKWAALPATRTAPGTVVVPPHGPLDPQYTRTLPEGGIILKVHARILDRTADRLRVGTCDFPGGTKASRDFCWIFPKELENLRAGKAPESLVKRWLRFHLIDNTRGEPSMWGRKDLERADTAIHHDGIVTKLDVNYSLRTAASAENPERGQTGQLHAEFRFDPATGQCLAAEVLALGDHWGASEFTQKGVRPGKQPLGFVMTLADAKVPAHQVAPQAAREWDRYRDPRQE